MKHLMTQITLTLLGSSLITGCSALSSSSPAHNEGLNSISSSGKTNTGHMQELMDSWFSNDWTPTISKDKEIQKKYMRKDGSTKTVYKDGREEVHYVEKDDKPFTLQEYVDKASAYRKANPNDYENSNVKKLESMPIIGK
jgi:hypothetical protein